MRSEGTIRSPARYVVPTAACGIYAVRMLVGRDGELRELLGAAAAAVAGGRGWTALVGGDAGTGKTRFAAEVPTGCGPTA